MPRSFRAGVKAGIALGRVIGAREGVKARRERRRRRKAGGRVPRTRGETAAALLADQARAGAELGPVVCRVCRSPEAPSVWSPRVGRELAHGGVCWACRFWRGVVSVVVAAPPSDPEWVVDAGRLFRVVYAPPLVRWTVTTAGGAWVAAEVVEVGAVPATWRDRLPDTGQIRPGGLGLSDILSALDRHAEAPATGSRAGA